MQMSVPEVMDLGKEPDHILKLYGAKPGHISAANLQPILAGLQG